MKVQTIKGTYDLFGEEIKKFNYLKDKFRNHCFLYNYQEIETPVIEDIRVFKRENDTSAIANKEMFVLEDDKALRPEGTAGVVRALVEHKLYANELPYKLFYMEKMYRRERPQKGRQREFTQLGVEVFGDKNPMIDAEVIALGYNFIKKLDLKGIEVVINSLGDKVSRENYTVALKEYFSNYKDKLSEDSLNRLDKNPLRILDSKNEIDRAIAKNAPSIDSFLSDESKNYFIKLLNYLDDLKIPYRVDRHLVRGLDYYTDTVFEVMSTNEGSGTQNTIFAGGRYDELVSYFEGPVLSGIGFAMGLERILILMELENINILSDDYLDYYIINLSNDDSYALRVGQLFREKGYLVDINFYDRKLKAQFKSVERKNAKNVVIIGDDEIRENKVVIKNIETQIQKIINFEELKEIYEKNA